MSCLSDYGNCLDLQAAVPYVAEVAGGCASCVDHYASLSAWVAGCSICSSDPPIHFEKALQC